MDAALRKGVDFLIKSQNKDGSWGTGKETRGFEIMSSVPGSLKSFQVATTALCVMALREVEGQYGGDSTKNAHDKGLEFLVTHTDIRRDDGALIYNTWAHTYGLQCLAIEMRHGERPAHQKSCDRPPQKAHGLRNLHGRMELLRLRRPDPNAIHGAD